MTKCNNCDNPAVYVFATAGAATQYFCEYDVPWSLQDRLSANDLPKIIDKVIEAEAVAETSVDAPTPGSVDPVVTDAPVDAPADAPSDTTTSKKKKNADPAPVDAPTDTASSDVANN